VTRATEAEQFREIVARHLGRARVILDAEGWPMVPGRFGRLEWRGAEPDGEIRVYAYTDARMVSKLRALPGVRSCRIGDGEAVFSCRADDASAVQALAGLFKLKRRRSPDTSKHLAATAYKSRIGGNSPSLTRQPDC
jgi:hypothetical protein